LLDTLSEQAVLSRHICVGKQIMITLSPIEPLNERSPLCQRDIASIPFVVLVERTKLPRKIPPWLRERTA
jgi:hypothetical protein